LSHPFIDARRHDDDPIHHALPNLLDTRKRHDKARTTCCHSQGKPKEPEHKRQVVRNRSEGFDKQARTGAQRTLAGLGKRVQKQWALEFQTEG
jgi:hypothetical protein